MSLSIGSSSEGGISEEQWNQLLENLRKGGWKFVYPESVTGEDLKFDARLTVDDDRDQLALTVSVDELAKGLEINLIKGDHSFRGAYELKHRAEDWESTKGSICFKASSSGEMNGHPDHSARVLNWTLKREP